MKYSTSGGHLLLSQDAPPLPACICNVYFVYIELRLVIFVCRGMQNGLLSDVCMLCKLCSVQCKDDAHGAQDH